MTDDSSNSSIAVHYTCGKCGLRWKGEKTYKAVGCPKCGNYSLIGFTEPRPERLPRPEERRRRDRRA